MVPMLDGNHLAKWILSFVIYLVTADNAFRARGNAATDSISLCFPQFELDQVATGYIPTNGTRVTRAADMVLCDVAMSLSRLVGVRDFDGPVVCRGLLGVDGVPGEKGDTGDPGPASAKTDTGDPGPAGAKGDTSDPGPAGAKGITGSPGVAGPKGYNGSPGVAWAKGDTGIPGPAGDICDSVRTVLE